MKRLRNFFRGRHKESDASEPDEGLRQSQTFVSECDAGSPFALIRQRAANEPVVCFRAPLTAGERKSLEDLPLEVLEGVEGGSALWREIVNMLSSPMSVNTDPDSVCRQYLRERSAFLCHFSTLLTQSPQFRAPSSLCKVLLITLTDRLNIAKFTSSLGTIDPFQAVSYSTDLGELAACVPKMMKLLSFFVREDGSAMLLHKKAVEMVVEFLNVLSDKVKRIEPYMDDHPRITPFLHLLCVFSESTCLLTELLKRHTKTHKNCEAQLQQNFNSLYTCINSLHYSSATEHVAWTSFPFLEEAMTPSECRDRNLILVLLTCLYCVSSENESFQMHVTKFVRKRMLTSLVLKLRNGRGLPQTRVQLYIQIFLMTLKIFRMYTSSNRATILLLLEEDRDALGEMLSYVCYYYYEWGSTAFHTTFRRDAKFLGRIYTELSEIAKEAIKTKVESQVFSLFRPLSDLGLYEVSKGKLPVVQSYTLEFLLEYASQGVRGNAESGGAVFPLIFSPLFVSALEDQTDGEYDLIDADAEDLCTSVKLSFFGVLNALRKTKEATESLVIAFITGVQQYKDCATFIRRLNSILLELLKQRDSSFEEYLQTCGAVESLFQLMHDCQVYQSSEECLSECGRMLLTLTSLPMLSRHILDSCVSMSEKIFDDYLQLPRLADFSIQYALNLISLPGSGVVAQKFIQAFATVRDPVLVEKLTAGLERGLSVSNQPALKQALADAHLLEAILGRLKDLESPDSALALLTIMKLALCDCEAAQSRMRGSGYVQLQDTICRLYHDVSVHTETVRSDVLRQLRRSDGSAVRNDAREF